MSAQQLATRTIEVVSVPAGHPYVHHTQPLDPSSTQVSVRPDPDPDDPSRAAGERWWPPVALEPEWLGRQRFDVLHVHFGYDERTPAQLRDLVDLLDRMGRPLVLTVPTCATRTTSTRSCSTRSSTCWCRGPRPWSR